MFLPSCPTSHNRIRAVDYIRMNPTHLAGQQEIRTYSIIMAIFKELVIYTPAYLHYPAQQGNRIGLVWSI